jgi:hypothetical protein
MLSPFGWGGGGRVVLIGWFVMSLLDDSCCPYWIVCVVIIVLFVLYRVGGLCCRLWVVCVVFGWLALSLLGGLCSRLCVVWS